MITINDKIIFEDISVILEELKRQLRLNGIERFYKTISTEHNIQTCCPFHKNGQERKPSFGILTKDYNGQKAGICHCFTCGWSGSLQEMISNCFGYDDFGVFGEKWLIKNFLTVQVNSRQELELDINRMVNHTDIKYVSEAELDSYRYYHPYMWKRKLTPEIVDMFDIGYDKKTECITFPNRDKDGNCLFVARRSVKTKFFNYPKNVQKPVYGVYELFQLETFPSEVIICESMLDALTCWVYGKYAVALNGLGDSNQFKTLRELPCRKYILATDNDVAGMQARPKISGNIPNKLFAQYILPNERKDINELSKEEFDNLTEIFM